MLRVSAKRPVSLAKIDPGRTRGIDKATAQATRAADAKKLRDLQERLYAENKRALLLVLQGMDTSGKDGTIIHVIGQVDPQGVRIAGFGAPTPEELRHDFLWRIRKALPAKRQIGIFNRSHYEDVLIVRVKHLVPRSVWSERYEQINEFERELAASGITIVKICLHISFAEQGKRLLARLLDPTKRWKFNPKDIEERARWNDYMTAYDAAIEGCNSKVAPWYIVPSDKKWYRNWAITRILIETLEELDPQFPEPAFDVAEQIDRTMASLKAPPRRPVTSRSSPRGRRTGSAGRRRPSSRTSRPVSR